MEKRRKTLRERTADLAFTYGSFAETGRRLARYFGVSEKTSARYVSEIVKGTREAPESIRKAVSSRLYYEQVAKPRREIRKLGPRFEEKIKLALNTRRREVDLWELLPPGTEVFAFDFENNIKTNPTYKWIAEAIRKGLSIRVRMFAQTQDGIAKVQGVISGDDLVKDPRPGREKKLTKRYISEFLYLARIAYNRSGAVAWLVSAEDFGDEFEIL